ncbi:hypothetical protein C8J57DRAFT_177151 [Mycena rebaudengoi]|nr:hypothetical protein C8J57DRAFT_177151 [Mycena rebaudengoi]
MSLPSAHAEAEALYALQVINYSCAAGLVILLYDHLLTFGDEVRLIWSAKSSTTKFMFLATRYLVPSLMILNAVALSGLSDVHLSDDVCKAWITMGIFAGSVTQAINSWLVLLRLWILWQRQRTFILCTLLLFIATELATIIGGWIGVAHILPGMFFEPTLHLCVFKGQFSIFFLRVPGLVFQFVVLAALAWKALRHGRTSLSSIYRDGFVYFLVCSFRGHECDLLLRSTEFLGVHCALFHLVLHHNYDLPDDTQHTADIERGASLSSLMVREGIISETQCTYCNHLTYTRNRRGTDPDGQLR